MIKDPEARRQYMREYRARNKERVQAYHKEYNTKNQERLRSLGQKWKEQNYEQYRAVTRNAEKKRHRTVDGWLSRCCQVARKGAKTRGIAWEIDQPHVFDLWARQDGRCAITGIQMAIGPFQLAAASLDRIDSTGGYVTGNVHLVCKWVNLAKSDASLAEFLSVLNDFAQRAAVYQG